MAIIRTPSIRVVVQFLWAVKPGGPVLTAPAVELLGPYLRRYGETLGILVHAVGGVEDHLHLLLDIPPTLSVDEIHNELTRASARYAREILGDRAFDWDGEGWYVCSISPEQVDEVKAYVREQPERHAPGGDLDPYLEGEPDEAGPEAGDEEPPDWLREVLPPK